MNLERSKDYLYLAATFAVLSIAFLAIVIAIKQLGPSSNSEKKNFSNVISVNGEAFLMANPDIALIKMTIRSQASKTKDAQKIVQDKASKIIKLLTEKYSIDQKDIKTENYTSYPKYHYPTYSTVSEVACEKSASPCQTRSKPILLGYETSQVIAIKIRNIDNADQILSDLGAIGVDKLSDLSFVIENDEKLKEEVRKMAIDNAKTKAKILAKQLGVKLVRITSFFENSSNQPYYFAAKNTEVMDSPVAMPAVSTITPGENKITSNVSITYEIE